MEKIVITLTDAKADPIVIEDKGLRVDASGKLVRILNVREGKDLLFIPRKLIRSITIDNK